MFKKPKIKFYRRKIEILTDDGEVACYYSDLMYVKNKNPYCWLHFSGGTKYKVEVSIRYLLKNLPQNPFFRCNRTGIINICYYNEYKDDPPTEIMDNGTEFGISVRNVANFKKQKASLKRISPPCPPCLDCKNENCPDFWLFCLPPDQQAAEKSSSKMK